MTLDTFFFYIHYVIIFGLLTGPFILPLVWIKPYILVLVGIIIQWYVFNGKCIISKMHKESSDNEGAIFTLLNKLNININDKAIDALLYILIIYSFYRIGCVKEGLLVVIIIILLNKTIYNSYGFVWGEKNIKN